MLLLMSSQMALMAVGLADLEFFCLLHLATNLT